MHNGPVDTIRPGFEETRYPCKTPDCSCPDYVTPPRRSWKEKHVDEFGMPCAVLSEDQIEHMAEVFAQKVLDKFSEVKP
jgi:hypothetical protein